MTVFSDIEGRAQTRADGAWNERLRTNRAKNLKRMETALDVMRVEIDAAHEAGYSRGFEDGRDGTVLALFVGTLGGAIAGALAVFGALVAVSVIK